MPAVATEFVPRASVLLLLYSVALQQFPHSRVPTYLFGLLMAGLVRLLPVYARMLGGARRYSIRQSVQALVLGLRPVVDDDDREELIVTVKTLQAYGERTKAWNDRRRTLARLMPWRHQLLAADVGYFERLAKVDAGIAANQRFLNDVALATCEQHALLYLELGAVKLSLQQMRDNHRVIESLGHFPRDWGVSDVEVMPLVDYIVRQIHAHVPESARRDAVVVVPGSGLGRVAHELAIAEPAPRAVHAVELSTLMHVCNAFVYEKSHQRAPLAPGKRPFKSAHRYDLHPYLHTHSNHASGNDQTRTSAIRRVEHQPENLHLHLADFTTFKVPEQHATVVIVLCFFMDTAENMLKYTDAVEQLAKGKRAVWINIGPLKYGTAPQVEFTAEELARVRKQLGWKDVHVETYSQADGREGLVPYLTNTRSMYQGFYGLSRWCCVKG